jgi:FdhD protein
MEYSQDSPTRSTEIIRYTAGESQRTQDSVAAEEPLEIRVVFGPSKKRKSKSLSITMRTPGHDFELAVGFLLSENVIQSAQQVDSIKHVGPSPKSEIEGHGNTLEVELSVDVDFSPEQLQRHFYMTSSCGVCGKASIEAVMAQGFKAIDHRTFVAAETITSLPESLRQKQEVFDSTGGLHAAGLFCKTGEMICLREDVGRHNAVDKLVGSQLIAANSTSEGAGKILVVSGRASFELVQKALTASFEMLVAVGAPSSLAVELAASFNLTLIGFASKKRFNVYSGFDRIRFR